MRTRIGIGLAAVVAGCGGGDGPHGVTAARCVQRFNGPAGYAGRRFIRETGVKPGYVPLVWAGPSRVRPDKCLVVATLAQDGATVAIRETFFPHSRAGFQGIPPDPGEEQQAALIARANAYALPDGRIRLGRRRA